MAQKKLSKKTIKIVSNFANRLQDEEKVLIERAIVFGSRASGKAKRMSDIDVCLISPKFQKPLEAMRFLLQSRSQQEVLAGLEPIGFTRKDFASGGILISEIKRTGIRVF